MKRERIHELVRESLSALAANDPSFPKPPEVLKEDDPLSALGITPLTGLKFTQEMLARTGLPTNFQFMLANQAAAAAISPGIDTYTTLRHMVDHVLGSLTYRIPSPEVVYVDDEEENLFVFKRKFGKRLKLITFDDPINAKEYILTHSNVVLVLTDEVMPGLSGNRLRDEIHKKKPFLRFILITGNPGEDEDLMYRSLKGNRFYDVFMKPLDLEGRSETYFQVMDQVLRGDFF